MFSSWLKNFSHSNLNIWFLEQPWRSRARGEQSSLSGSSRKSEAESSQKTRDRASAKKRWRDTAGLALSTPSPPTQHTLSKHLGRSERRQTSEAYLQDVVEQLLGCVQNGLKLDQMLAVHLDDILDLLANRLGECSGVRGMCEARGIYMHGVAQCCAGLRRAQPPGRDGSREECRAGCVCAGGRTLSGCRLSLMSMIWLNMKR